MVEHLERRFRGSAAALTRSALIWALMGYVALILGLAGSIAVVAGCVALVMAAPNAATVKLALVFGLAALVIAWSILRGAWIRFEAPDGEELRAGEAPELFRLIDETSALAGGIPLARVIVTPDLNACVVQSPRLGIFGWHRNHLCLGMQLMDSLTPEEFHAVLAHEFAHLSKSHGRTGNWIYRIRRSWENVAESLASQGGLLVRPLAAFFGWFWPRFNARAFVLSRANEYEADAFSARATSPATAASALVRVALESRRSREQFWEPLAARAATDPEPPRRVFHELAALARTAIEPATAKRWLDQELARVTDTSDTHPALRERVEALGAMISAAPVPLRQSAADRWLGVDAASRLRDQFGRLWSECYGEDWKQAAAQTRASREQLERLGANPALGPEAWEVLRLKCEVHGLPAMTAELASFVRAHPEHHGARFMLGQHLLSKDEAEGVAHMEHLALKLPQHAIDCYGELAAYHDRRGNSEAIRDLKQRADEHEARMERAVRERHSPTTRDRFLPHDLTPSELDKVLMTLNSVPHLSEAWLARKECREMPEWKGYVLIVRFKFGMFRWVSDGKIRNLIQQIINGIELEGYLVILHDKGGNKAVAKRIRNTDGTRLPCAMGSGGIQPDTNNDGI